MKATLCSGLVAVALAGYGIYDYVRPVAASVADGVAEDLAKIPESEAKEPEGSAKVPEDAAKIPEDTAKVPEESAKVPEDQGTILD